MARSAVTSPLCIILLTFLLSGPATAVVTPARKFALTFSPSNNFPHAPGIIRVVTASGVSGFGSLIFPADGTTLQLAVNLTSTSPDFNPSEKATTVSIYQTTVATADGVPGAPGGFNKLFDVGGKWKAAPAAAQKANGAADSAKSFAFGGAPQALPLKQRSLGARLAHAPGHFTVLVTFPPMRLVDFVYGVAARVK